MTVIPDVLWSPSTSIREQLETLDWAPLSTGMLAEAPNHDGRAHVVVLHTTEAERVWVRLEPVAIDAPVFPVLVGDISLLSSASSPLLKLATVVSDAASRDVVDAVRRTLKRADALVAALRPIDSTVESLSQNAVCECARCSVGIVVYANVRQDCSVVNLAEQLELIRHSSYALVDRIPTEKLSTDDLWALMLVVTVPWSRSELDKMPSEAAVLSRFVRNTQGSRKIVLTTDQTLSALVGPVASSESTWRPTSDDPLREQLSLSARDSEEREALGMIFKRRFTGDDIDQLIAVLGRRP